MLATTLLVSLAAAASAAVLPRQDSQYGYWDVSLTSTSAANGFRSRDLTSVYNNPAELNDTITVHCTYKYEPWNTPTETASCDDDSFSYELGSPNTKITQTVELWGEQVTLRGEGPIDQTCGGASGRVCTGEAKIDVSTAVA